jgi:hypothetical protein
MKVNFLNNLLLTSSMACTMKNCHITDRVVHNVRMKHIGDKAHYWRPNRIILGKLESQHERSSKRKTPITGI